MEVPHRIRLTVAAITWIRCWPRHRAFSIPAFHKEVKFGMAGGAGSPGPARRRFWPRPEVIRKGKASRPTEFGKLVKLQEAENQIIVAYEVYARRPNDSDLLMPAIEVHAAKLGLPAPRRR